MPAKFQNSSHRPSEWNCFLLLAAWCRTRCYVRYKSNGVVSKAVNLTAYYEVHRPERCCPRQSAPSVLRFTLKTFAGQAQA
eukprot:scaffold48503_cov33-Prasinocladus_malaysianus.AAC.1